MVLGTMNYERQSDDKKINVKLIAAYQKAYDSYNAACERYDKLLQAYRVLKKFNTDEPAGTDSENGSLPYTEKIMKRMIEDARKEKSVIADHAMECIQHLRSLKYEM